MDSVRPFRAFVSYCHADAAFAAWLQRRLEGYRLPRRLADQVEPLPGQAQGRIGPVFRDRADLSAASDLSAAVREGIAASSALVVVASPDAVKSQWVAREIELFRELHPEAPILVALARGEPHESLPEVLRSTHAEPLCADFRKHGDGKRLAFLKIVAGLSSLPLDALVQRDAQRQMRRVMGVIFGAALLLLIMALLLAMALRSREEAERRRARAEGLVQFMVTTLRDRLKTTGHLEVMDSVNDRAIRYFEDEGPATGLPEKSALLRALIYHSAGEDDAARGAMPLAAERFREAYRTTYAVLSKHPRDADALYTHAQSEFWTGYIAWQAEDLERTRKHWEGYLRIARTLAEIEPGSTRALMELGYSHGNLCELSMRMRTDVQSALTYCRQALEFERMALKQTPGDSDENSKIQMALANRMGWLADALTTQRMFMEARALRMQEAALYSTLRAREPASVELRDRVIWPQIGLAKIDIGEGRIAQGLARLEKCLWDLDRLSEALPDNEIVIGERARVNILIAKARRDARLGGWRTYRDRAGALLAMPATGALPEGLKRYRRMLDKLDERGEVR
jgi:hypothetical protein